MATPSRPGFATRLLIAQSLVLIAGALTAWLVALAVGPRIFHDHLDRMGVSHSATEAKHVEEAFSSTMAVSLLVAVCVSTLIALVVTWYFTRRVQRSILAVADSASEIAAGHYDSRVSRPGLGEEFDGLAETFNELAERLDAVEVTRRHLLADLAHEMRTPLATIDAHLEAVEDGVRDVDDNMLSILRSSTERLRRLAQDVSTVSRAEEGVVTINPVPVSAADLASAAVEAAQRAFDDKGVALILAEDPSQAPVIADPERMGQVLGNLLENSLRHTSSGGTVTVTCREADEEWVELTVRDDGEGIAAAHLPHVFDRFYRADSARNRTQGGSGIGLTITKALVQAQGGSISADSDGPGTGSTFTVRMPVPTRI